MSYESKSNFIEKQCIPYATQSLFVECLLRCSVRLSQSESLVRQDSLAKRAFDTALYHVAAMLRPHMVTRKLQRHSACYRSHFRTKLLTSDSLISCLKAHPTTHLPVGVGVA